jgi:hypothetical protein
MCPIAGPAGPRPEHARLARNWHSLGAPIAAHAPFGLQNAGVVERASSCRAPSRRRPNNQWWPDPGVECTPEVRQVKPRQSFARDAIPSTSPAETAGTAQTSKASMNWASTRGRDGLRQPRKPAETCRRRPALLENHFRTSRKSTGRRPVAKQRRAQKSPRSADRESPSSVGNMTMRSTE